MARNSTPARGKYTGTGAAVNIPLGFIPGAVMIFNVTDGDEVYHWSDTMADDTAIKIAAAAAAVASGGVKPYAGSAGSIAAGFTVGANISENGKEFHYIAWPKD